MSSKEEALFTQERVLSITGDTGRCIKCSHLVLAKLSEQDEIIPYASRGIVVVMMVMMMMILFSMYNEMMVTIYNVML
jgi:hypothetical protein